MRRSPKTCITALVLSGEKKENPLFGLGFVLLPEMWLQALPYFPVLLLQLAGFLNRKFGRRKLETALKHEGCRASPQC